jgi:4-hydroxy-tetrahydrodipicolinate synthase
MTSSATFSNEHELQARLADGLIPAVPVPHDSNGRLHSGAQESYVRYLSTQPVAGVAVWAHTGRGLMLNEETARVVLHDWRSALPGKVVVAGVGSKIGASPAEATAQTIEMSERAAVLGADALLVYPPTWLREHPSREALIIEHHERVAEFGLPVILFYLYEAAGGINYTSQVLDDLLSLPQVIGIKVATLDSVMTYQDIARQVKASHREKLLITGEDRFLGYSLRRGAQAALIGLGAICSELQSELIRANVTGNAERFLELSDAVDMLAEAIFINPMEGYIKRLLWALVHLGVISADAANDPWGPGLPTKEFDNIGRVLAALTVEAHSG